MYEDSENHSFNSTPRFHLNDLEEPVEQLKLKHSTTAIICSNSLSLTKSVLQGAERHITRQHTPIFLSDEVW